MATFTQEWHLASNDIVSGPVSSGLTYANPDNAKGPSDGLYAGYGSSTAGAVTVRGTNYAPNVPANATITGFRYRWGNDESTAVTATCRIWDRRTQTNIYSATASFRGLGGYDWDVTPLTPLILNNMEPIMTVSGTSSRRRIDFFGITLTYTTPDAVGPQLKVFRNGTWTTTTLKKYNGTAWTNAIIKKI